MNELVEQAGRLADELHRANAHGDTLNWILAVLIGIFVAVACHIMLDALKLAIYLLRTGKQEGEKEP